MESLCPWRSAEVHIHHRRRVLHHPQQQHQNQQHGVACVRVASVHSGETPRWRFGKQGSESDSQLDVAPPGAHPVTGRTGEPLSPGLGSPSAHGAESPTADGCWHGVSRIGEYLLVGNVIPGHTCRALHTISGDELVCKVYDVKNYRDLMEAHYRLAPHRNINPVADILLGDHWAYVLYEASREDLHAYVRSCRHLPEDEAARLFEQVLVAVAHCHSAGVVLRDLKLRKFVFRDPFRTELKLESLEDAFVLSDDGGIKDGGGDDSLSDKHGCPAYVSPEILSTGSGGTYSGRAADMWSLGIMLYTMLVGRYPFQDAEPAALFQKIRRGQFALPEGLSARARCLVRSLLRRDPAERLSAQQALEHPWFQEANVGTLVRISGLREQDVVDQLVPDINSDIMGQAFYG
uniref:Protein kinase domain-containing protein n=1 Tax=Eptatretus burgeri TaxID=7764 RepID=A0A8C4NNX2_EPTBU